MNEKKIDRRRKYYLVLDCETATLPFAKEYNDETKKKVAIAKPLIYDIGWQLIDRNGNVYRRKSYLITEIFSVPSVFNTAYYAEKRPIYLERLKNNETILTDWNNAIADLENDMQYAEAVGAYNSMFDFKKAIPFTELYINMLYSENYQEWESTQHRVCDSIANGTKWDSNRAFQPELFVFRGKDYPLFDVWGLACEHILNCNEYKEMCYFNKWQTESGKYFKTSAETCFRFCAKDIDFIEAHTAIDDTEIESKIFVEILKRTKNKFQIGIIYFPFRILGRADEFMV